MSASVVLAVALAGALGAAARYALDTVIAQRTTGDRPWGTLTVNVTGSLLLGLLVGLGTSLALPATLEIAIGGGFLGAYTTFSTWMVQGVELAERGAWRAALANVGGGMVAGAIAAAAGLGLGAWIG